MGGTNLSLGTENYVSFVGNISLSGSHDHCSLLYFIPQHIMFKSGNKKRKELLANYAKIKKDTFYFNSISQYFLKSDKAAYFQVITDKTYHDLDMDEVFMYVDRTSSKVGQQFLYHIFRTIPESNERNERFESLIRIFNENSELKESVIVQLSRLNSHEAYYIASLFQEDHILKPKWFWVVQLLSIISITSVFLSFIFPQFLILLLVVLAINYFIHYWNKENLFQYIGTITQLLVLKQVAKKFAKSDILTEKNIEVKEAIKSIDQMGFQLSLFKLDAKFKSEIGQLVESLIEILKATFLIEPIVFFNVLKKLNAKRNEIHQLYTLVGEIDVAIAIASLRTTLPYYSHPTFTEKKKQLITRDIYHPLLDNIVSNSIALNDKSVLLTGSNMSGKTTFIRTIGINAITSQTINTCFAREFVMPRLKVHSAIRITDDLMRDRSYYFEEVLRIGEMLEESRSASQNLFLLDEMFKGTNTIERIAAGKSVLDYLNSGDNIVFISTHDLEMTEYLRDTYNLYHFTEVVDDKRILFDYKIKAGLLETTNAIRILALNDYPPEVIAEAKELSEQLKKMSVASQKID